MSFYNDSKATNVDAVLKALTAFPNNELILLLGGHDKQTPLEEFVRACTQTCKAVICYGEAQERFYEAFTQANSENTDLIVKRAYHLKDALDTGYNLADENDVVLLSPACSSFDEFSGYEERGRVFKSLVAHIADRV